MTSVDLGLTSLKGLLSNLHLTALKCQLLFIRSCLFAGGAFHVTGVVGFDVQLPCEITPLPSNDSINLVRTKYQRPML